MSAEVRKRFYRMPSPQAEFPEQRELQAGPGAFPLRAISRATVQFPWVEEASTAH